MDDVCLSCHAVFTDLDDSLDEEDGCLTCHDSKYSAPDVGDEIRKASNMGTVEVGEMEALVLDGFTLAAMGGSMPFCGPEWSFDPMCRAAYDACGVPWK